MYPIELPTPSNSRQLLPTSATRCDSPTKLDTSDAVSTRSCSSNSSSSRAIPGLREASSPKDLAVLLQRTYAVLRAKEKDIRLAAQVGRALLENNLELKAKHESVVHQMRARQRSRSSLQPPDSPELIIRPSTSILTRTYDTHATASRILERVNSADSHGSTSTSSSSNGMRLISRDQADQAIVEMLAQKNGEIEYLLDSTIAQHSASCEAEIEKHRRLENEMIRLQSQLDLAAQTIEELENQKKQYQQDVAAIEEMEDSTVVDQEMLAARLDHLQVEHKRLLAGNDAAQHRLDQATKSLSLWQQQIADLETIDDKYKDQENAYHHQFAEIARLTGAIEDYRMVVADVQDDTSKSILSHDGDNNDVAVTRRHRRLTSSMMVPSKSNLFSELERACATSILPPTFADMPEQCSSGPSSIIAPPAYFRPLSSSPMSPFLRSPSPTMLRPLMAYQSTFPSTAPSTDYRRLPSPRSFPPGYSTTSSSSSIASPLGDLSQSLYVNLSACYNKPLRNPPSARWISKHLATAAPRQFLEEQSVIIRLPCLVVYKIWSWYRFSIIVFLAIIINLWRGPDAVLEK